MLLNGRSIVLPTCFPVSCQVMACFSGLLQRLLNSFVRRLFTVRSFDAEFPLVVNVDGMGKNITMPEGIRSAICPSKTWEKKERWQGRGDEDIAGVQICRHEGRAAATCLYECVLSS